MVSLDKEIISDHYYCCLLLLFIVAVVIAAILFEVYFGRLATTQTAQLRMN